MTTFLDKTILVIGGSRGIGAAIVKRLADEGGTVSFTYAGSVRAAAEVAAQTGARAIRSDASDREALIATVRDAGPLDILVVSAGAFAGGNPLDADPDAIDRMIDLNIRGPYHAAVEAARKMRDDGRIIIIGSVNGDRMPFSGGAAYAMTKSAVQGIASGLARDLGPRRITVNVVQPGPVATDMNPPEGEFAELLHGFMALKRHGKPDEIAAMVSYLAGPEASFVTGAKLTIDGGFGA